MIMCGIKHELQLFPYVEGYRTLQFSLQATLGCENGSFSVFVSLQLFQLIQKKIIDRSYFIG